jgi:hypothetical protein
MISVMLSLGFARAEVADCIVALVNNEVVTLADLRISEEFILFEPGHEENSALKILEKLVDQKIVLDLAREKIPVDHGKVEEALERIKARLGPEVMESKLEKFGLGREDLKIYLEDIILYQNIIDLRFGQSVSVSLKEIETYYREVYVPSREKTGQEVRPMIECLNEIEAGIKKEKIRIQIDSWIKGLRRQAEIEVRTDCLK